MNKNTQYLLAGALGLVVMVVGFNSIKDSFNDSMYGTVVKPVMEKYFLSPPPVTEHGREVDQMIVYIHLMMLVLFIGWTAYFLIALWRFRKSRNAKADYAGVTSKVPTTLAEYGVIAAEVVLIGCFAVPLWGKAVNPETMQGDDIVNVDIISEQFMWNAVYPGPDGKFGKRDPDRSSQGNKFDILREGAGLDDISIENAREKDNPLVFPFGQKVVMRITSRDVIHSLKVLPLRVCQDAIPGLEIGQHFTVNDENAIGKKYLITCAQLCGDGHATMRGYVEIRSRKDFDQWVSDQSAKVAESLKPKE